MILKSKIIASVLVLIVLYLIFSTVYKTKSSTNLLRVNNSDLGSFTHPFDAGYLEMVNQKIFDVNSEFFLPSYAKYRNSCWFFRLYNNVTNLYEDLSAFSPNDRKPLENKKSVHINFRNEILLDKYNNGIPQLRCLPHIYFIGFPKCASTDFYDKLSHHPQIFTGTMKEYHWWTKKRRLNVHLNDYMNQFDLAANDILTSCPSNSGGVVPCVTVDGSPSTIFWSNTTVKDIHGREITPEADSLTPALLKRSVPNAQLLVIVKNPTLRLVSEFYCFKREEVKDPADLHQSVMHSLKLMNECILINGPRQCAYNITLHPKLGMVRLHVGMYYYFLKDWLSIFPRNQMFIFTTEEYSSQTNITLNKVAQFLQLESFSSEDLDKIMQLSRKNVHSSNYSKPSTMLWTETKTLLDNFYKPYNGLLANLLKEDKYMWSNSQIG